VHYSWLVFLQAVFFVDFPDRVEIVQKRFPSFESLLQNRCRAKRTVALAQEDEIQAKASIVKPTKLAHFFENAQLRKAEVYRLGRWSGQVLINSLAYRLLQFFWNSYTRTSLVVAALKMSHSNYWTSYLPQV